MKPNFPHGRALAAWLLIVAGQLPPAFATIAADVAARSVAVSPPTAPPTPDELAAKLRTGAPEDVAAGKLTALENYIRADDGAFAWKVEKSMRIEGAAPGEWFAVRLTSQKWRTDAEVDFPLWTHWLNVWVPDKPISDKPILFIGGGRRRDAAPDGPPGELRAFAASGAIVAVIDNVPNQPMKFAGEPAERNEDGMVARTWLRAMETGDATWLARFPMVKAAVKAIDATEALLREHPPRSAAGGFTPGKWLVAGGSKRGWTTWLTAAVEPRVGALAPIVIDVLDVPTQMRHHHDAYGFWAPALNDYVETGLSDRFVPAGPGDPAGKTATADPLMAAVLAHEDPIHWLSRVGDRPKYLINAASDEFFLPDSARFYQDRLPSPWRMRYIPNSGHGLKDTTAGEDLGAFYHAWATGGAAGAAMPEVKWTAKPLHGGKPDADALAPDSTAAPMGVELVVQTGVAPTRVLLWQAENAAARDFRIDQIGRTWTSTELTPTDKSGASFRAEIANPPKGFRAGFVEVTYGGEKGAPGEPIRGGLVFTTRIYVTPDVLPHAAKP